MVIHHCPVQIKVKSFPCHTQHLDRTNMQHSIPWSTDSSTYQTDYNTEVNTTKYIAQENGYDPQLIEILKKLQTNKKETYTDKKLIILTHHNKSTQKISKSF